MRVGALCLVAWALTSSARAEEVAAGQDFFTTQVRPILAQHCFKCHGPDDKARKAKLRLDVRDEAVKPGRSGKRPVVPGKPDESELIRRVLATDDDVMPPPAAKLPLSDAQRKILKRWVEEGAEYRPHWAFVKPRQPAPPKVMDDTWPRNPIDRFVLSLLEKEELKPTAEADRYTLIRRLSLDLIGLPPTVEEADAFVNDKSKDAYEKLVDRLLASPHYGERWARRWLDLARYADTNGYEKDRPRSVWPYRDWVISALNRDLPFDRFTIEQIAGDMLPKATRDQRIATGFHRNTMLNEEGGIDPLEFRYYAVADRVATTGTVWLGLTLGCAQCHTHKFDPVSHKEYYQLFAFLNNADEPQLEVSTADTARARKEAEEKIAALVAGLTDKFPLDDKAPKDDTKPEAERRREHFERQLKAWTEAEAEQTVKWTVLKPVAAKANLPLLTVLDDGSVLASGDQSKRDVYDVTYRSDLKGITAIRLEVLPDPSLPRHGPGRVYYEGAAGDFFLSAVTLSAGGKKVALAGASASYANGKFTIANALDDDPQSGWAIDGGQGRPHSAVFNLAAPLEAASDLQWTMLFERYHAAGLGRFRVSVTTDPRKAVARDFSSITEEALLTPTAKRTAGQLKTLREQFVLSAPELAKERQEIDKLRKQLPAPPTTLVMQERPPNNPRTTHLHNRGEFLQPTDKVEPAVPAFLHPLPKDAPRDRLGFARWLVSPDSPLVGRVTMNRQWAAFFGQGLVRTVQDFGYQGEAPSHPELLDWLAVEFVRQGWSVKKMQRLIVTSATYRQSSAGTAESRTKDPDNRLLSRGPRVRLEAEQLRDQALRASGLLSSKIGGPSVFPPQPPGVTTEGAYGKLDWKVSQGEDRYRRGLYTFMKRTAPFAAFSTFDGPSGEVCVARREVSNTPLQALTLLNDQAFAEASQTLGRLLAARKGSVEERVEHLFQRCLTRPPRDDEKKLLVEFYATQKKRFEAKELDAAKVAGPGDGDANERAAWTALARVLLNLDEAIARG